MAGEYEQYLADLAKKNKINQEWGGPASQPMPQSDFTARQAKKAQIAQQGRASTAFWNSTPDNPAYSNPATYAGSVSSVPQRGAVGGGSLPPVAGYYPNTMDASAAIKAKKAAGWNPWGQNAAMPSGPSAADMQMLGGGSAPSSISSAVDTGVNKWKKSLGQAAMEMSANGQTPMFTNRPNAPAGSFVMGDDGSFTRDGRGFTGVSGSYNRGAEYGGDYNTDMTSPEARRQFADRYMDSAGNRFDGGGSIPMVTGNSYGDENDINMVGYGAGRHRWGSVPGEHGLPPKEQAAKAEMSAILDKISTPQDTLDQFGRIRQLRPGGDTYAHAFGTLAKMRGDDLNFQGDQMRDTTTRRGDDLRYDTSFAQMMNELDKQRMANKGSILNALIGERSNRYAIEGREDVAGMKSQTEQDKLNARGGEREFQIMKTLAENLAKENPNIDPDEFLARFNMSARGGTPAQGQGAVRNGIVSVRDPNDPNRIIKVEYKNGVPVREVK